MISRAPLLTSSTSTCSPGNMSAASIEQPIDGNATFVVQIGPREGGAIDLDMSINRCTTTFPFLKTLTGAAAAPNN